MKRFTLFFVSLLCFVMQGYAQRVTDKLDRGLVAVPASSGNFISWRIFAEEYYGVTYNLYAGESLLKGGLKVSNYTHSAGTSSTKYKVVPVINGVEREDLSSNQVTRWDNGYKEFAVAKVQDRNGNDVTSQYIINDISLGDVDGDGVAEFLVKRNYTGDVYNSTTCFHHYECYKLSGERLWWIDLGPNMMAGPDEQWDMVLFDWDQDGKAEAIMRGADNMIIHTSNGETVNVGDMTYVAGRHQYTCEGAEYFLYINGSTGEPYNISGNASKPWIAYPLPRYEDGETDYVSTWGGSTNGGHDGGHRSSKHYFGAPFLDGRKASIFLGRGCYTRHKMIAYDVDPATHKLTERWRWSNNGGWSDPWFGNGYHNFGIADVDEDGRDEIVFGSMVIDDNGKGLSTTGLGHGDAQHCGDFDPYRKGLEFFACNEDEPNMNYRNATTSKMYYRVKGTADDGRALMGNFSNSFPGCMGRTVSSGLISAVADKELTGDNVPATGGSNDGLFWSHLNFRIYWTGDLVEGILDSPGTEREAVVWTTTGGRVFQSSGCQMNNDSKNNPCATGDIIGDWREEIVLRADGNTKIRIYTTPNSTTYRIPTLWHDHQYRNAMVWQCMGYNQPPHTSFFLGQMEGITVAPPPYTMTGRTEIKNGGTISSANAGQHVIVCETNNTEITVADGANPTVATFNVPSWVQGTNSNKTDGTAVINYTYYTCNVTGGAFTGAMTLAKQGDGILSLPKVDMTYTGATNVWAGTLNFDGSLLQSSLWLNRHTTLNSNGGSFRSIKADYGSTICPTGSITTDSLLLGFGSRLKLNAYSDGLKIDQINTKYLSVEAKTATVWQQYGPRYLTPVVEIVSHGLNGSSQLEPGKYLIGSVETLKGSIDNIKIEGIIGLSSSLLKEDGKLYLVVKGIRDAGIVYWTGASNSTWNYAKAENFQNAEGETDIFVTGDKVIFDDAAKKFTVTLNGELDPDTVIVDNTKAYTFNGTGSLTGKMTLIKRGTGTLTIGNDNTYTGKTLISGGTVKVSVLSNQNKEYGNLGAVSSSNTNFIIENGATLQTTAAVEMGTPIRVQTVEGGVINNSADFSMNKSFVGTRLTKKGTGWLKLYANNTLDTLCVAGGTVQAASECTSPANVLELQGGTMVLINSSDKPIYVPEGKTAAVTFSADRGTYSGKLTGGGTVTISYPLVVGSGWYADRCHVTGNWSAFTGTVKPVSGISADGRFCLNSSTGLAKGTINLASGVILQNTGKAFAIGLLTGSGTLGGVCTLGESAGSLNTWTVGGANKDFSFAGKITAASAFTKTGTGKMTFTGSGDFTGACKVNAGELCLNSSKTDIMLGTSTLTVANGATLSGKGVLGNSAVTVNSTGTLRSGITETNSAGNLKFSSKNVTVNGTIQTYISSKTSFSKFTEIGTLKLNGKLVVRGAENLALSVGDEIQLFDASTITLGNNLTFDLCSPNPALGLTWDTSRLSEGILVVAPAADGIMSIRAEELKNAEIYTIDGKKLSARPKRAGLYIVNGAKTFLK